MSVLSIKDEDADDVSVDVGNDAFMVEDVGSCVDLV